MLGQGGPATNDVDQRWVLDALVEVEWEGSEFLHRGPGGCEVRVEGRICAREVGGDTEEGELCDRHV